MFNSFSKDKHWNIPPFWRIRGTGEIKEIDSIPPNCIQIAIIIKCIIPKASQAGRDCEGSILFPFRIAQQNSFIGIVQDSVFWQISSIAGFYLDISKIIYWIKRSWSYIDNTRRNSDWSKACITKSLLSNNSNFLETHRSLYMLLFYKTKSRSQWTIIKPRAR